MILDRNRVGALRWASLALAVALGLACEPERRPKPGQPAGSHSPEVGGSAPSASATPEARTVSLEPGAARSDAGTGLQTAITPMPPSAAVDPLKEGDAGIAGLRCREQPPQDNLLRKWQLADPHASAKEFQRIQAARDYSIDYRTRHYGKFPGFGHGRDNPHPPRHYAELTHFMGLPVLMHRSVVPALACAEKAILQECASTPYQPTHVSGFRDHNTYIDYEVSNHVYGIALDIDSDKNPCCGCIGRWNRHKSCRDRSKPVWQRMAMPECWVRVFERYGFYWLGHDELEDTMHFEFLGDPERILGE